MYSVLLTIVTLLSQWQFTPEQQPHQLPAPDAESWQSVTIPHDWAITTDFDRNNDLQIVAVVQNGEQTATAKTGRSGGLNWMGAAWYKCQLDPALISDKELCYSLYFDGAMSHAEVFVNGQKQGSWEYGYNAFEVDITSAIRQWQNTNNDAPEVQVRLENFPESSRWYPGAGLYRKVSLRTYNKTHIPLWGVNIRTPKVDRQQATVTCDISVANPQNGMTVTTDIYQNGQKITSADGRFATAQIDNPKLWSPETPYLYEAHTFIKQGGIILDSCLTRFGIRSIEYTYSKGFLLNGEARKFKGVCLHHDLGPLGTAIHRDAIRHQLTILKNMGCDAVRTSHNMPATDLVELCEEMGLMLMIEPFDEWTRAKCRNGYTNWFEQWAERDMQHMLLHFRNSPAVVMWSTGNEVWEQVLPEGLPIAAWLQNICHKLDPTRPVTNGMDQVAGVITNGFAALHDIPGFNYRTGRYLEAHDSLPERLLLGSENASTVSSRDTYHFPVIMQPNAMHDDMQSSGYDVEYCAWSGLPEQDFQLQDDYDWTIGQFVWTGFDYLGEPSPYDTDAWPSHSSYFGIIDLASIPKDRYWLYRSQWNKQSPTLHVLPHWTWQGREGETTPVYVYTSYPEAELFVNGKSQGRLRFATAEETERLRQGEIIDGVSRLPQVGTFEVPWWGSAPRPELLPRYRLMWQDVKYAKGEIKVVAYDSNGAVADQKIIKTAGKASKLQIEWANKEEETEEGLCYLTVTVTDSKGTHCPHDNSLISLNVQGGKLLAMANGDATCLDKFQDGNSIHAFHGKCTFIVRKNGTQPMTVTASAPKMKTTKLTVN